MRAGILILLLFLAAAASADERFHTIDRSSMATIQSMTAMALTIQCQKGSVSFSFTTGEATYTDCTPEEGARSMFNAFAVMIRDAQGAACVKQKEEKAK